jgi:hypothetical protein
MDLKHWQRLIDSGEAWRLSPWHSQMAASLIASGQLRERRLS